MTFWRPGQIRTDYRPVDQTTASREAIFNAKCTVEAATLFALAGTVEFSDDIITARTDELAALATEFGASPDVMQAILVSHDRSLAIPKKSEWTQRWRAPDDTSNL